MNHKDLLIAAGKAAGIEGVFMEPSAFEQRGEELWGLWNDGELWNPIANKADRWDLCERCGLTVDFQFCRVSNGVSNYFYFTPNDDESQAIAVLQAAVASKGD